MRCAKLPRVSAHRAAQRSERSTRSVELPALIVSPACLRKGRRHAEAARAGSRTAIGSQAVAFGPAIARLGALPVLARQIGAAIAGVAAAASAESTIAGDTPAGELRRLLGALARDERKGRADRKHEWDGSQQHDPQHPSSVACWLSRGDGSPPPGNFVLRTGRRASDREPE